MKVFLKKKIVAEIEYASLKKQGIKKMSFETIGFKLADQRC